MRAASPGAVDPDAPAERDSPVTDTAPVPGPADEAAALRAEAELLRRRANEARREGPRIVVEAQHRAQQLSAEALRLDRDAAGRERRAAELREAARRPPTPPGRRVFGRAG
jgi:hypothetical protein